MFGLFHKKEQKALELGAPVSGQAVPLQEVSDPTFGGEILGKGVAVRPTDGRIYAPADGEITLLFDTLHALSMTTDTGAELLLHIGLDTVALKGAHFKAHVKTGDKVRKGDHTDDCLQYRLFCRSKSGDGCGGDAAGYGSDSHIEVISYSMVF